MHRSRGQALAWLFAQVFSAFAAVAVVVAVRNDAISWLVASGAAVMVAVLLTLVAVSGDNI